MQLNIGKQGVLVLLVLLVVIVFAGLLVWYLKAAEVRNEVGKAASSSLQESEESPYTTLNGEPFTFATYRGTVRIVHVWASWSPSTVRELPIINQVAGVFADQNVVAIAVNRREPRDRAVAYLAGLGNFENLVYAIDETDAFYRSVGGYAMPETLMYNAAGDIVWHHRGEVTEALLSDALRPHLSN